MIEVTVKRVDADPKVIRVRRTDRRGSVREYTLREAGARCSIMLHEHHRLEFLEERTHGT